MTIVNDNSSVVSKLSFKLIDNLRVIIYHRHRFIIQATGLVNVLAFLTNVLAFLNQKIQDIEKYLRPKVAQVSISPTFYEQLLRQNPFAKKLETQIVST